MSNTVATKPNNLSNNEAKVVMEGIKNQLIAKVDPTELSELQSKVIGELISKHSNNSNEKTELAETDKAVLRWILQSASENLNFTSKLNPSTPNYVIPLTDFESMKEIIEITHNREIRDIDPTPSILIEEGSTHPTITLRLKTAIAIIMTDAFNTPIDRLGKETRKMMMEITKLAKEIVNSIYLTLIEQKVVPNLTKAKSTTWSRVPIETQTRYCILFENRVLYSLQTPISRCKGMWMANHYLQKAMNSKT